MTTTVAPDLKPDHTESEQWPTLGRDPTHAAREEFDPHSFDLTQGRKIGSDPYDDPTQGRKLGSDPYDDPTQGRKLGSDPYDDATQGRRLGSDPYDDPTQGRKLGSSPDDDATAPTTTRVRSGIAPLVVVLALGLAVLALMLSIPTSDSSPRHASGASTTPHIAR
jgi:hypothetical protein